MVIIVIGDIDIIVIGDIDIIVIGDIDIIVIGDIDIIVIGDIIKYVYYKLFLWHLMFHYIVEFILLQLWYEQFCLYVKHMLKNKRC